MNRKIELRFKKGGGLFQGLMNALFDGSVKTEKGTKEK
jgi:hypothetical protein